MRAIHPFGSPTSPRVSIGLALLVGMLAGCSDSSTDTQPQADLVADMTGDRESGFAGSAVFRFVDDVFEMEGSGEGVFEGHEMWFTATAEGVLEPGSYTIGRTDDDEAPDLEAWWRMAIAIFTATEGTFTITSASDDEIEGTFSYSAIRSHVCSSFGHCDELGGAQPINQVEGSFRAVREES